MLYRRSILAAFLVILSVSWQSASASSELVDASVSNVDGATTVDAAAAKDLFDSGSAFVDLRKSNAWDAGRVPGAIHLDFKKAFSEQALKAEVGKEESVVFYCSGVHCPRSSKAAKKALAWGYTNVYYFREGFPAWKTAGYPVE